MKTVKEEKYIISQLILQRAAVEDSFIIQDYLQSCSNIMGYDVDEIEYIYNLYRNDIRKAAEHLIYVSEQKANEAFNKP